MKEKIIKLIEKHTRNVWMFKKEDRKDLYTEIMNLPIGLNTDEVTRVEVIDSSGRSYVNWEHNNSVDVQLQDNGRTLKVFVYNPQ